jgi:hypothetical protein
MKSEKNHKELRFQDQRPIRYNSATSKNKSRIGTQVAPDSSREESMSDKKIRLVSNVPDFPQSRTNATVDLAKGRREATFLISEIRKLKEEIRFKDRVLRETLDVLECGLDYGDWPTLGQLMQIITRIKVALEQK